MRPSESSGAEGRRSSGCQVGSVLGHGMNGALATLLSSQMLQWVSESSGLRLCRWFLPRRRGATALEGRANSS